MKRLSGGVIAVMLAFGTPVFGQGPRVNGGSGENTYVELAAMAVPSVVNISTISNVPVPPPGSPEDFFRRFFGEDFFGEGGPGPQVPPHGMPSPHGDGEDSMRAQALGTGFVIEASRGSALILTNHHVVQGAHEISVTFTETPGEQAVEGKVVGHDPELDVALIRVETDRVLRPLKFGDSDALKVGEYVAAIGNPFGQGHSISHGIISAKGRPSPDFPLLNYLQTDTPINPGNSGGPLLNLEGEVVGVNNAILQEAQGIGFAIPINLVKEVLPQLRTKGTVSRGYIGVLLGEITPEIASKLGAPPGETSPFITHVYDGSPAEKAGIKPYDVVDRFNDKEIRTSADLVEEVIGIPVGRSVPVVVNRGGSRRELTIIIAERPGADEDESMQQQSGQPPAEPRDGKSGLGVQALTPELTMRLGLPGGTRGVIVASVNGNSPAEKAGLQRGDVILEVDRKQVENVAAFKKLVKGSGDYLLRVRRPTPHGGKESVFVAMLEVK